MEDTVVTRAINAGRKNWPWVVHSLFAMVLATVTIGVAIGHRQADGQTQAKDFQNLKAEVEQMHSELTQVKESQARTEGTLGAISLWAQGVSKFQTSVQAGAAEALATPIPKSGHRAHKP